MDNRLFCDPCEGTVGAKSYCDECQEYLCDNCVTAHKKMKATKQHVLIAAEEAKYHHVSSESKEKKLFPGKPKATEIYPHDITLVWDPPTTFRDNDCYQISFKEMRTDRKWRQYKEQVTTAYAYLSDMKSNTTYIFRVRVIQEDGEEGPFSTESEEIQTTTSLASRMVQTSKKVEGGDITPIKYALPLTEIKSARNEQAKTRRFEVGTRPTKYVESKTIMLVGATGTGKSTFVDGIINYVLGVTWSDPFRYTIIDLESDEKERIKNQAISQTEWITCYAVYPENGSRLTYQLQIIDTPGFGDTRGLKRDQEITSQIRQMFSDTEPKGVTCIDAVCFLIKAPDARLTPIQNYIFQSIMSLFGKDIKDNICYLCTFADSKDPPVLAALEESELPLGKHFTFNNIALFAKNVDSESQNLSQMFWNKGLSSFHSFFIHLEQMRTKSLQLTKDVLVERYRQEAIVRTLRDFLDVGLGLVDVLKRERKLLKMHKTDMEENKDYKRPFPEPYVEKTLKPGHVHDTKCENCYVKCHPTCAFEDNEQKRLCIVMDGNGHCTVCPDRCKWTAHKNDAYTYTHGTKTVMKTIAEIEEKYKDASGKALTKQQIIEKNESALKELTDNIEDMMLLIKHCNENLQEIALRPNPLTMTNHIDLMIENEKMTKKEGFLVRIKVLSKLRKDAEVYREVKVFTTLATEELGDASGKTAKPKRPLDSKSVLERATRCLEKHIPDFSI